MKKIAIALAGIVISASLLNNTYAAVCAIGEPQCNSTYPGDGGGSCWGGVCNCAVQPPANCCDSNGVSHQVTGCKANAISNASCNWVDCSY